MRFFYWANDRSDKLRRLEQSAARSGIVVEPIGLGQRADLLHDLFKQRALFHPRGLFGHAYWWSVYPFHAFVFPPMVRGLARHAEEIAALAHAEAPDAAAASPAAAG